MKRAMTLAVVTGLAALCTAVAFARPPARPARPDPPPHPMSLEQAVKEVQHQTNGHILAADSVARGQNKVYRIKVLKPDGKVQVMQLHSNPPPRPGQGKPESDRGGH